MSAHTRIQKAYKSAKILPIDKNSKLILMSDCHRGTGSGADDFAKNQNIYNAALNHYYREGFTYIELGDGDELWENRHFSMIAREYMHVFSLLGRFHKEGRLHMIYGNHDLDKKDPPWVANNLENLFPGIKLSDGLVLRHEPSKQEMLLIHGHQADFFNYKMWRLARFLVRYLWQPLELVGVQNPFNSPRSPKRRHGVGRLLVKWSKQENKMLIAGHTHRTAFPNEGEPLYYNVGSTVHRRYITGIEIENDIFSLVKWSVQPRDDNVLIIKREVVESGPVVVQFQKERIFAPKNT